MSQSSFERNVNCFLGGENHGIGAYAPTYRLSFFDSLRSFLISVGSCTPDFDPGASRTN